ncbi:Gfo/Idh/MocA family oxidoreductase [Hwanghaeella grinnelliae]|uniref:Gfo/Idh/MocA family oxidoreductase n=1 Tax=Hwanghaeella grinnelliae TaxID=2500179 RepID=A0A3S3UPH1_9PROT|nr:Gfo/Idh/MocA family oxidoreductase [Hwanghaeella grinnelliae]RVU36746.1 Gfo/Idh/MocA family oxidoreductase [Hwanghaeella grinnelliae]
MKKVPNVAVIGAGGWGKNHVRNFHALGALRSVCDPDTERLSAMVSQYDGVAAQPDLQAILDDPDIDGVVISSPGATHGEIARAALQSGKHVFAEKPLCLDLEEGKQLRLLAEERGLTLMVGHLLLYHPAFIALQDFVAQGGLGDIRYAYSNRTNLGRIRNEENALWSFAPHDISMLLSLIGEMPSRIVSNGGTWLYPPVADTSLTHMDFSDGVQAHIFVSWLHPFKDQKLVVVGTKGMAVFDDTQAEDGKLVLYDHRIGWNESLPEIEKADATPIPYERSEPLRNECQHFLDCITNGTRPRSDAAEGLRVLAVLDACERALRTGETTKPALAWDLDGTP